MKVKNGFKRTLALFLVVVLALTGAPLAGIADLDLSGVADWFSTTARAAVYTEGDLTYAVYSGKATITKCSLFISGGLVIPDTLGGYPVTRISGHAFYDCSGLTSITIPDSVTFIGERAFYDCSSLTSITIPNSVTGIGDQAFADCAGLTSITVSPGNKVYHSKNNCIISIERKVLIFGCKNSVIPSDGSVTSIGSWAFKGCTGLTSITIPNSVTSIGDDAFYGCTGLTSMTIPNSVTSIGDWAFVDCTALTSITIPNSVTRIGYATFRGCTSLTSITIPNSVTNFYSSAFEDCTGLTSITVSSGNKVYHSENNCIISTKRKEFILGCKNSVIPSDGSVTSIGSGAFCGCTGLTSITIPNSVTSIGSSAFFGCTSLTSITIPDSVTSIGGYAFKGCTGLTSVTIGNSVTSIGDDAFYGCTGLTSITIPNSVTSISYEAFYGCTGLKDIYYSGTSKEWEKIKGYFPSYVLKNATVHSNSSGSGDSSGDTGETTDCANGRHKAHTENDGILPTCTEPGLTATVRCSVCGEVLTEQEEIPETGHADSNDDGVCDSCGADLLTFDEKFYIAITAYFAENTHMPENFGFYNKVWKNAPNKWRRLAASRVWSTLGDVGKVMTFSFDDLSITADYYDIYLTELIVRMNNASATGEIESKAMSGLEKTWKALKKLLKSSDQWEESVKDGKKFFKELEGVFFEKKDKEVSEETKNALSNLLRGIYKSNPEAFNKVFSKLNMINVISGYISDGFDIANYFIKTVNAYQSAVAYKEYGQELFDILYEAAANMENDKYSNWFKNAIDKYYSTAMSDDILISAIKDSLGDAIYLAYDIILKELVKSVTYSVCAKVLGCTAGAFAASAFAVSATYNITYFVLDKMLGLGGKTEAIYIMNYISEVEKGLCAVEDHYATKLCSKNSLTNANSYNLVYKVLKNTNLYLYQAGYSFCSLNKETDDMEVLTMCTDTWNEINPVKRLPSSVSKKYISTQCPVDVIIYNSSNEVVLEIKNEKIEKCNEDITALVFDGKKSIILPNDCDYRIEITARENGKMDYYISELVDYSSERNVEFYDLELVKNSSYYGDMPAEQGISKEEYDLLYSGNDIVCNYDSNESSCGNEHTYGEWTVLEDATYEETGLKCATCSRCGHKTYDAIEILSCNHICHKGGISKFFYKIARIFWKIFKKNRICKCGIWHY